MATQNFASSNSTPGPLLLGVIYRDANFNGSYNPGEGVKSVSVTPTIGGWYAISSTSGGYVVPYSGSGPMVVSFDSEELAVPVTVTANRTGKNIKLDIELLQFTPLRFVSGTLLWSVQDGFFAEVSGPPITRFVLQTSVNLVDWLDRGFFVLNSQGKSEVHDMTATTSHSGFYRLQSAN